MLNPNKANIFVSILLIDRSIWDYYVTFVYINKLIMLAFYNMYILSFSFKLFNVVNF